jgi:hypothetical protein
MIGKVEAMSGKDAGTECQAPEIEITPEMIAAGMEEYNIRWRGLCDADDSVAREMLRCAFIAMSSARRLSKSEANLTCQYGL